MRNVLITIVIAAVLPAVLMAQLSFDFEVRGLTNEFSDQPVYITQFNQLTDTQKFCLAQHQIQKQEYAYRVDHEILALSYVVDGTCTTQFMRKRDFETSPRTIVVYPDRPAEVRSVDLRLFDTSNKPVTNELFFFETDDPEQQSHPNPNHFDGHHLRTKIYKRYLIIVFRIDEQQTGQFTVDCKTDMRGNLIINSVFSTRCNTPDCLSPSQASDNYKFLRRM